MTEHFKLIWCTYFWVKRPKTTPQNMMKLPYMGVNALFYQIGGSKGKIEQIP